MKSKELQNEELISQLQESIYYLRMSRRILLTLLEQSQNDYKKDTKRLTDEIKKLQRDNRRYARVIWQKNKQLVELQRKKEGF